MSAVAISKTKQEDFSEKPTLGYPGKAFVKLLVLDHSACMGGKSVQKPGLLSAVGIGQAV